MKVQTHFEMGSYYQILTVPEIPSALQSASSTFGAMCVHLCALVLGLNLDSTVGPSSFNSLFPP